MQEQSHLSTTTTPESTPLYLDDLRDALDLGIEFHMTDKRLA